MAIAGQLGTGDYTLEIRRRRFYRDATITAESTYTGGETLGQIPITNLSWGRALNQVSGATASVPVGGEAGASCVEIFKPDSTPPWPTDIPWSVRMEGWIFRNGVQAWRGPLTELTDGGDELNLTFADLSWWWARRISRTTQIHKNSDHAAIWSKMALETLQYDNPGLQVVTTPTGIVGTRETDVADLEFLSQTLNDLSTVSLDWTTVGGICTFGAKEIDVPPARVTLDNSHFEIAPRIRETADGLVTTAWASAGRNVASSSSDTIGTYGVVEDVSKRSDLGTREDAAATAATMIDFGRIPPTYVESGQANSFKPSAPVSIDALIPGKLWNLAITGHVLEALGVYRMSSVSGTWSPEDGERIWPSFEPVGTSEIASG